MSYELNKVSATRPALTSLASLRYGNAISSHKRNFFASTSVGSENEDGPIKRLLKKITNVDNSKSVIIANKYF